MVFHLFISVPVLDLYLSSLSLDYAGCFVLFDIDFGLFDPIARKKFFLEPTRSGDQSHSEGPLIIGQITLIIDLGLEAGKL